MANCRECGVELVAEANWYPSLVKKNSRICIECRKAQSQQWRKENPKYCCQYHQAHQEERNEYSSQWRGAHREERRKYDRQWRRANPSKKRENKRRRRARKVSATIKPVGEAAIYDLYGHRCIYCGAMDDLTLDHIVPLANGGEHRQDNLVVACRSCNSSKRDKPLQAWLRTRPYSIAWLF